MGKAHLIGAIVLLILLFLLFGVVFPPLCDATDSTVRVCRFYGT